MLSAVDGPKTLPPSEAERVKARLASLIAEHGSQAAVARLSGISQQAISKVMRGETEPGHYMARKLASLSGEGQFNPPQPTADARTLPTFVVDDAHEKLIEAAFLAGRHSLLSTAVAREMLRVGGFLVDPSADPVPIVAAWLDAATRLQRRGEMVTPRSVIAELSRRVAELTRSSTDEMNASLLEQAKGMGLVPTASPPPLLQRARERALADEAATAARLQEEADALKGDKKTD